MTNSFIEGLLKVPEHISGFRSTKRLVSVSPSCQARWAHLDKLLESDSGSSQREQGENTDEGAEEATRNPAQLACSPYQNYLTTNISKYFLLKINPTEIHK